MLAALVLEILGVERRVIVADYVITAERLRFILERWQDADEGFAERMAKVPASRFSVEAATMEGFLDQLQIPIRRGQVVGDGGRRACRVTRPDCRPDARTGRLTAASMEPARWRGPTAVRG